MRDLLYLGSVVVWTGYVIASAFIAVFSGPLPPPDVVVLLTAGTTLAVIGSALVVGVLSSNAVDPSSESGRRYLRRLAWVCGVLVVISIALTIAGSIVRQAPIWVSLVLIALTIVCTVGPILAAERYRRRLEPERDGDWEAPASERARTFRQMGIVFVVAAVIVAVLLVILNLSIGSPFSALTILGSSLGLGAISATVPALRAVFRSAATLNRIFGTDIDSRKAVGRVVVRRRPIELTPEQQTMAARFAHVMRDLLPIQYAQSGALILGIIGIQSPQAVRGDLPPLFGVIYLVIGAAYVVLLFVARRQYRSVRDYASAHPIGEELPQRG